MSANTKSRTREALKEWAVACRRIAEGRQIVLLRKGGIADGRGGMRVEHREFFLFPTLFHQREEELVPDAREELAKAKHDPAQVPLEVYVTVEDTIWVEDLERLRKLEGKHCLAWPAVEERFNYRGIPGLWVIAVRAYRLPRPQVIPNTPEYDGCKSWVTLATEVPVEHSGPVLSRADFLGRCGEVKSALSHQGSTLV